MRILIHAQHLSGAGHYVRARAIAAELATTHEVVLLDAGRPLPLAALPGVRTLELPRIRRDGDALAPLEPHTGIERVMSQRRQQLGAAVADFKPQAVLIEHYPFSKWDLAPEIHALIAAARAAHGDVKLLCSVRDLPLQTRHEACSRQAYAERVLETLGRDFDALLVHGDAALTPLADAFPESHHLRLPVQHTGIVHDGGACADTGPLPVELQEHPFVLCSVGGGDDSAKLLATSVAAWQQLRASGVFAGWRLALCAGVDGGAFELDAAARTAGILSLPFNALFGRLLRQCRLSISNAGYNTCADLLRYGVRSILLPNPHMSDQLRRAALMQRIGAADVLEAGTPDANRLAEVMKRALSAAPRRVNPAPDLRGAENTRACIETLVGG